MCGKTLLPGYHVRAGQEGLRLEHGDCSYLLDVRQRQTGLDNRGKVGADSAPVLITPVLELSP